MIPQDLLTRAYARGGFAYAEGRYDIPLTKHVHGGFGRCSNGHPPFNGRRARKAAPFAVHKF